jgi:RHS repeat-associated protein
VAVAVRTGAATSFVFQDHLGSTVAAFDDTTNTPAAGYYYPYGEQRHQEGSLPSDRRYTGQTSDATQAASAGSGLYYYHARYYDPQVGAFTTPDTLIPTTLLSTGLNRYTYVSDNPVNGTDPSGHCSPALVAAGPWGWFVGGACLLVVAVAAAMVAAPPDVNSGLTVDLGIDRLDDIVRRGHAAVTSVGAAVAAQGTIHAAEAGQGDEPGVGSTPGTAEVIDSNTRPGASDDPRIREVGTLGELEELHRKLTEGAAEGETHTGFPYLEREDESRVSRHDSPQWGPTIDVWNMPGAGLREEVWRKIHLPRGWAVQ